MGIFSRNKGAGGGLGRSVEVSEAPASEAPRIGLSKDRPDAEAPVDAADAGVAVAEAPLPALVEEPSATDREVGPDVAALAEAPSEVKGKSGKFRFGRGGTKASDRPAKQEKAKRGGKSKDEASSEADASDQQRLSTQVMIDFLPGLTKEDAIEWARRWAMTHMSVPANCFFFVQKYPGGFAVEVQEGVGKAYLPSVIDLATKNPGRIVVVPMSRRKMTVTYSARMEDFDSQILPERQEPPATAAGAPLEARRSSAMTPVMKEHKQWLVVGGVTAAIGGAFLLASTIFYAIDPAAKVPPEWQTTEVAKLPVMQWSRLQPDSTDSFVVRLEYQNDQWRIVRQAVGATAEVADVGNAQAVPVQPGQIQPGAPGGAPASPPGTIPPPPGSAPPAQIPPPAGY